jgi:hypothetical protein
MKGAGRAVTQDQRASIDVAHVAGVLAGSGGALTVVRAPAADDRPRLAGFLAQVLRFLDTGGERPHLFDSGALYRCDRGSADGARPHHRGRGYRRGLRALGRRSAGAHLRAVPPRRGWKSSGLGLGLYIVERIVHAHGGTVTVRSTLEDGTTCSVRLPRRRAGDRGDLPTPGRRTSAP